MKAFMLARWPYKAAEYWVGGLHGECRIRCCRYAAPTLNAKDGVLMSSPRIIYSRTVLVRSTPPPGDETAPLES